MSSELRSINSILCSIQLDQIILFRRLEKLEALERENSLRSASEIKTEIDMKEALEDEKAVAFE